MRCDVWAGILLWWGCRSPVAHSCNFLNHLNTFTEECWSLMQNLMQIHCSAGSVILNAMATQYTCSLNSVYHPHWLVQWSHHCPCMCIPVHSPWLPGYIDITQTILVILTMGGFFLWTDLICVLYINLQYIFIAPALYQELFKCFTYILIHLVFITPEHRCHYYHHLTIRKQIQRG